MKIKDYFNKSSRPYAWNTVLATALSISMLTNTDSIPVIAFGMLTAAYSAGQLNMWKKTATDKPLWKPKVFEPFGW